MKYYYSVNYSLQMFFGTFNHVFSWFLFKVLRLDYFYFLVFYLEIRKQFYYLLVAYKWYKEAQTKLHQKGGRERNSNQKKRRKWVCVCGCTRLWRQTKERERETATKKERECVCACVCVFVCVRLCEDRRKRERESVREAKKPMSKNRLECCSK